MPIYYTTTNTISYPYDGYHWTTSTTTDCSGFTYKGYKEDEIKWMTYWLNSLNKSLKEPEITEEDVLALLESDN